MSSFGYGSLVFGTRDNSSGNVANTLIQFNSIQERKREKESKSSQLSLFPWAKIWLCLYHHSSHFACDYDLESFIFPPLSLSLSLFFFFLLLSILSVSLQFLDNPSRELTHPHSTCHFFRKSHPIIALFLFRHSHFISHKI